MRANTWCVTVVTNVYEILVKADHYVSAINWLKLNRSELSTISINFESKLNIF